jgi:hypothetical protein
MRIFRSPDFVIWQDNQVYMNRWWIIPRNKWFNIYLHQFLRSDEDRALHDHPWWNISFLLRGTYLEHKLAGSVKLRKPGFPVFRFATTAHRVELIEGKSVWSLFITGRRIRTWGFYCPNGWVPWREFVEIVPGGNKNGKGCDD